MVLALLAAAFGRWPTDLEAEPSAFMRWKHEASPFGRSLRLVAKVDGEIAGFLALMPWRLCFAGTTQQTLRAVDFVIAPNFQGHGFANALIAQSRAWYPSDVSLVWSNPNHQSRHSVLKGGDITVQGPSRFVGLGGAVSGTAKRLLASGPPLAGEGDESLAVALADRALLAQVLSDPRPAGRVSTACSVEFLRWRYGQQGNYGAVVCKHPRGGAGIAIFRTRMRGRFSVASICELLAEHDDERVVRELVRRVRRRAGTDLLTGAFTSARAARRCGLVRSRRTAMIGAYPLHDRPAPNPAQASAWALSPGDLELI